MRPSKRPLINPLSVPDRLRAAFQLIKSQTPTEKVSVVGLCKAARVSRATVYTHHPALLKEFKAWNRKLVAGKRPSPAADQRALKRRIAGLKLELKALTLLCVEQMAEIKALRTASGVDASRRGRNVRRA